MKLTTYFFVIVFFISLSLFNVYPLREALMEISIDSDQETPRIENNDLIVNLSDIKCVRVYTFNIGLSRYPCLLASIEYTDFKIDSFLYKIDFSNSILNLFSDDKLIFEPVISIKYSAASVVPFDVYLSTGWDKNLDLFFNLMSYFPDFSASNNLDEDIREQRQKENEEKSKMRNEQYQVFLKYLKDASKLIDVSTGIDQVPPQKSNGFSIYPNPTTGELRIRNYELGITN